MKVNADNIPAELKFCRQWVMWRYEQVEVGKKPTKVPYSPRTGFPASPTNKQHWGSFDEAMNALPNFDGIGFVLTSDDPYCFIDFDQPRSQEEYDLVNNEYAALRSYTEISPSGTGMHVITKAYIPRGRKQHPIEVYSNQRFMTMTGNVHWNLPIEYRQHEVETLVSKLPEPVTLNLHYDGSSPPTGTDREVWNRAASAVNGEKFMALWNGAYQAYYSSQSEADFALMDILAFYTQNREQLRALFRMSGLGQRDKAKRDKYLDDMINKSFDTLAPPINMEYIDNMVKTMLSNQAAEAAAKEQAETPPTTFNTPTPHVPSILREPTELKLVTQITDAMAQKAIDEVQFPDGMVGEIADYIYRSSPRPVKEIALAAALGLMAGICGSAYNISNTGVNLYIVALAPTGTGKEALQGGISRLMENVRAAVPSSTSFIGAGEFASPQALITHLQKKSKNFVSVIGECGMWLKTLSDPRAQERHSGLRRLLLDVYGKSGQRAILHPTAYADSAKSSDAIRSPSVTLLGESTQTKFYECVDDTLIAEGFVPRWLIISYDGDRPPLNREHATVFPSSDLMQNMVSLCTYAHQMIETMQAVPVTFDDTAQILDHNLDKYCDAQINSSNEDALRNLWSRVHMKVMKVAALIAIGRNMIQPVIDEYCFNYARELVLKDTQRMCGKYNTGEIRKAVDAACQAQTAIIMEKVRDYFQMTAEDTERFGISAAMKMNHVIPYMYFQRKLISNKMFTSDRRGASVAIQSALQEVANMGILTPVNSIQAKEMYSYGGKLWAVSDPVMLTKMLK